MGRVYHGQIDMYIGYNIKTTTPKRYYMKKKCIDCGSICTSLRCRSCQSKRHSKLITGKNNPFYGHKMSKELYDKLIKINTKHKRPFLCIDCGKKISDACYFCGTKRCLPCSRKGERNPMYGKSRELSPTWKGGVSFEPYPLGWDKTHREQIRYRDKYTCQLCGIPEVECIRKLHVHHIDYNKKNIIPENLISLCNACHSKTNHNRDYWIKHFTEGLR